LNSTFLTMAMMAGLDAPITDPLVKEYTDAITAFEALTGRDVECAKYIEKSAAAAAEPAKPVAAAVDTPKASLYEIIRKGHMDRAASAAEELLAEKEPLQIVEEVIIPALEAVGKDYETGVSFLPQLIKSADTVRAAFVVLKEAMAKDGGDICYGKIVIATVEGDIHDIGKNIVKVLLENYGYEVVDLGKDVPVADVVKAVKEHQVKLVGLSALMTTTVVNMEKTIQALREEGLDCKIAVGGAVLTKDYAQKIGADYYCREAMDTVKAANELFK
jgi:5-methyltetrahydrofolate--homocysteine methyltransferase